MAGIFVSLRKVFLIDYSKDVWKLILWKQDEGYSWNFPYW